MSAPHVPTLPQTCYPAVWLWPGQALYAGPSLNLDPHSGSVWCLAIGADDDLTVTAGDVRVVARSVLVPPRLIHHLDTHGGRLVSCYFDAASHRAAVCRAQCRVLTGRFAIDHANYPALRDLPIDDATAQRWLDLAAPAPPPRMDPRIAAVVARIETDPAGAWSSRQLAGDVGLSESRFLHLFHDQAGTTLRRYRLWLRLITAAAGVGAGKNLTEAAADAGFASPSHLADRFKSTFGLSASQLLNRGTVLHLPKHTAHSPAG